MKPIVHYLFIVTLTSCGVFSKKSNVVRGFGGTWDSQSQDLKSELVQTTVTDSTQIGANTISDKSLLKDYVPDAVNFTGKPDIHGNLLQKEKVTKPIKNEIARQTTKDDPEDEKYTSLLMLAGAIICAIIFFIFLIGEASLAYTLLFGALAIGLWTASLVVAIKRIFKLRTQGNGQVKYDFLALMLHGVAAFLIWLSFQ